MKRTSAEHRFATKYHAVLLEDLGIACQEIARQIPSPSQEYFAALGDTAVRRSTVLRNWCDVDRRITR